MKGAYFFLGFLGTLICLTGKAQAVKNTDINQDKKTAASILPPQLSYPANKSIIGISNPVFMWIPPHPTNGMMVTYTIRLVKVEGGQTPQEALLQNPPLLNLSGLANTFISYPADAPALQPNSQYAWQVAASSGGQSLGMADICLFSYNIAEKKEDPDMNYPVASKVSKERFYVSHGIFHFVYNNTSNEKTLTYSIKIMDQSMETIQGLPEIKLTSGKNKLQVDLQKSGKLKNGIYYCLEIKDSHQQVYKVMYYYLDKTN